jgi:glycosyltransferase involved in cell wall biosynthesis
VKTKVWIVIWALKDGGAETLAREYAKLVDRQQFDTTVVTMYPLTNTANYQHAKAAGIRICPIFKKRNVITRVVRLLFGQWYIPFALKKMLAKQKPDTIHFNSPMALYFAPLAKQLSGVNLLYTCHSEVSQHFFDKEDAATRKLIQEPGLRLIALHDDMKRELDQCFGKEDTVVIRNGVDIDRFRKTESDRNQIRDRIGIAKDAYVVGHIGRFAKVKNHPFLLQVFREIAGKKPNAHLLLIGNGELQEEVTQLIHQMNLDDKVTILSHRSDIPDLLHAMDVLVFPSFYEGLSVVLVEAQASGLKCVVSDSINPANLLSETTIPVSLDAGADAWAEIAVDDTAKNADHGNIEDYNMNTEIHRLERLYQGQPDV